MHSEQGEVGTFTPRLGAGQPVGANSPALPAGCSGPLEKVLGLGQESGGPERPRGRTFQCLAVPLQSNQSELRASGLGHPTQLVFVYHAGAVTGQFSWYH